MAGAVVCYPNAQVQNHGNSKLPIGRESKIVRREQSRECVGQSSFRGPKCGSAVWRAGNNCGLSLAGVKTKALAGDLSSQLFSSGWSSSILEDNFPKTRESGLTVRLSGQTNKSILRKSFQPQSRRPSIPWTSWRVEKLVQGFSMKKDRRRIVHPMSFLGKRRSAFEPEYLVNHSRLGTFPRCRVSVILPREQPSRSLLLHAKKETSPEWDRQSLAKVHSFSQVSGDRQILEASTGPFSPVQLTTTKASAHIVKSRAWTAWKQVLSSTSFDFRDAEIPATAERVITADQNSCTFTWHCSPPVSQVKVGELRDESQDLRSGKVQGNNPTMKQDKGSPNLGKKVQKRDLVVTRSDSKLSPRELAVGAIFRALSPNLDPKKNGQGELALRLADFVSVLKASAQTNEIKHCERQVQASLAAMIDGAHLAQLDFDIFQLWLDVTEVQLMTGPREADVLQLLNFLDDLQSQSQDPQNMDSLSHNGSAAQDSLTRDLHGADKERRLESILQAALQLEQILANTPSSAEICANLTAQRVHTKEGLRRQEATTVAAVKKYREALEKGEVAWFKNLDKISSRLELVAKAVLPMETAFKAI